MCNIENCLMAGIPQSGDFISIGKNVPVMYQPVYATILNVCNKSSTANKALMSAS